MKTILAVVFALLAFPAHAIVVTGEANSFEDAKQQAFKKAIDHEIGVIVDTERVTYDRELILNQILTYSGGYVLDYKVISRVHIRDKNLYIVNLDVTVASSKLKNFLLSHAQYTGKFNGENIRTQIDYYQKGLLDGDKLVANTLKYFPSQAINITMSEYNVVLDENRNFYLEIPYQISWDQEYLSALGELLSAFSSNQPSRNYVDIDRMRLYFYDKVFMNNLHNRMTRLDFVEITLTTMRGDVLLNTCVQNILYDPVRGWNGNLALYSKTDTSFRIHNRKVINNYVTVLISSEIYNSLQDINQIELQVTSNKDCPTT